MSRYDAAAQAIDEFFDSLITRRDFGPELMQKLLVAATPVIVAQVLYEIERYDA